GASAPRRCRTDPRQVCAPRPRGRSQRGATPCASTTCGANPRTTEWRRTDPLCADAPGSPPSTTPTDKRPNPIDDNPIDNRQEHAYINAPKPNATPPTT